MSKKKSTGKTLFVVESPNKIKKLSKVLGDDYIIRASVGHIIDLSTGEKGCRLGVEIENDFKPRYRIIPDKKDKIQAIIDAATQADQVLLATDPDREGEAIAWHLASCLKTCGKPIYRVTFNSLEKQAVLESVKNPRDIDMNLFEAQQARRVLDRIVGFLASDFVRISSGPNLSAGRVQSVALKLIVDREEEIEQFKPEEFWNINANLAKKTKEEFVAKYDKKVTNKTDADKIKKDLDSDTFQILSVTKSVTSRNPYPPLITSTLQQAVSTRYGFPVKKTMSAAQGLYEAGHITYIRTDSTRIEPAAINSVREFLSQNGLSRPAKPNFYKTKGEAQDAHEAIRPANVFVKPGDIYLTEEQEKVYRVIWERFVASQMEPAQYDSVVAMVQSSSGHLLKAQGRTLKYEGWLQIATDQKKEKNEEDALLPSLQEKETVNLVKPGIIAEQKFTQPPKRYSEASLVKELDKRGIGRPSTFATIVETIKHRDYVVIEGKTYRPTDIGRNIIHKLSKNFKFMDYSYTAEMEQTLDKIAEGNLSYVQMMNDFFGPFQQECKEAELSAREVTDIPCQICGAKTILRHSQFGFFISCSEDSKHTHSVEMVDGKPVLKNHEKKQQDIDNSLTCPKCNGNGMILNKTGKFGPFYFCKDYPRCKGTKKVPFGKKCPKCGYDLCITVFNGDPKLTCMGYSESHNCKYVEDVTPEQLKNVWDNPNPLIAKGKPFKKRPAAAKRIIKNAKPKKV